MTGDSPPVFCEVLLDTDTPILLLIGLVGSGVAMMLVGGYETTKRPELVKAAFPFFSYESKGWGLNVPIIPKYQDNPGVIAIQIKFRW